MITQIANSLYDQLVADFEARSLISISEPEALSDLRENAFEQFKRLGFPSTKVEDWKYTNLTPFLKEEFETEPDDASLPGMDVIAKASIPSLDCYRIVLVNGKFQPDLSDDIQNNGVTILSLPNAVNEPAFATYFGKYIDLSKNHFAALNTALFREGLYVNVKSKTIVDKPLHIINVSSGDENLFLQPRSLFIVGANAELSIIESYTNLNHANVFINSVSEIIIKENALLQHYSIQTGNINSGYVHHTEVHQQGSSIYNNYKASFPGTSLLRNNLNVALDGSNIESHLYGLYLSGGHQLVDNHTIVDHRKPHCHSNELYKGVMQDEATGVFNGKIFVRKDAQKTNAFQKNNNLMLSKKAIVDSKPQLEIFADDVKCSHGSTIGQFNDEALFYLKSRGIGEEKARALLVHAFAFDVTEKFPIPEVKTYINHLIEAGLRHKS
jgi:Fe-S cluster assembly protein SufD